MHYWITNSLQWKPVKLKREATCVSKQHPLRATHVYSNFYNKKIPKYKGWGADIIDVQKKLLRNSIINNMFFLPAIWYIVICGSFTKRLKSRSL